MFSSNTTQVSESGPDAQFNYVTMLLHGDGTNGAQNNTFVDGSTNNFTITRNGNTTQGSFSPYGSGWSNVFDGSISSAYLSVATNAAFNCGTGNFTVEAWVNITAYTGSYPLIIGNNNGGFSAGAIALTSQNATSGGASKISLTVYDVTSGGVTLAAASTNTIGGWTHFAVVRNGTSLVLYINGASSASTTISSGVTFDWGKNGLLIGGGNWDTANGYYAGYISNLRLVKGTAVYTSAFTPSTTPLTAISGTSLLTCQSNRFIDNSSNAFAITVNGPPSVQRFNPFGTSTAYSTSVIGGSGYFDGSGDYLSIASATAIDVSTGDFTVEFWANPTKTTNSVDSVFGYGSFTMMIYHTGSDWSLEVGNGSSNYFTLSTSRILNAWTHIAITRSGNNFTFWKNGVSSATATNSGTIALSSKTLTIGWNNNTSQPSQVFTGYINDFRIVKGTALYTTAFTPPTAPLTAITNTSLLANMTNGAIFDNAMMNDLETVGNAQISTSVVKYGTGSLAFDGTGDGLVYNASPNFVFGTGNFTVEFWLYLNANQANFTKYFTTGSGANGLTIGQQSAANVICIDDTSNVILTASSSVANTTWTHIALVRSGTTLTLYYNGTSVGSVSNSTNWTAGIGSVGSNNGGTQSVNGYIDDLRVTKGYARYTANFTAPTAAFSNTGPV